MSDSSKRAAERSSEDRQLAEELVERARNEGVDLVGPDGILSGLTKRRLTGVDEMVISLVAKGLTTGEVQAHMAEVYWS